MDGNNSYGLNFNDVNTPSGKPLGDEVFLQSQDITCTDTIEVGDVVQTKGNGKIITIISAPYHTEAGEFDFAGFEVNGDPNIIKLFNRRDIEFVVVKAGNLSQKQK